MVAVGVPDWATFSRLRDALVGSGVFTAGNPAHRVWFGDQRVDLIPFGGVERPDRRVAWPPDGAEVMNVSGFKEALATAIRVRLPGGHSFRVASLPAQAVLKLWAWHERSGSAPGKDASDLWLLLRHYGEAGNEERLYGPEVGVLAACGFDLDEAGARLPGRDVSQVLAQGSEPGRSLESLEAMLGPEVDPDGPLRLVGQMPRGDRDRQLSLLRSFRLGLSEGALGAGGPRGR